MSKWIVRIHGKNGEFWNQPISAEWEKNINYYDLKWSIYINVGNLLITGRNDCSRCHPWVLNLCDEIILLIMKCTNNKKGRTVTEPAFLQINHFCVSLLLNFSPTPANPIRPRPRRSIMVGSGTGLAIAPKAWISGYSVHCCRYGNETRCGKAACISSRYGRGSGTAVCLWSIDGQMLCQWDGQGSNR